MNWLRRSRDLNHKGPRWHALGGKLDFACLLQNHLWPVNSIDKEVQLTSKFIHKLPNLLQEFTFWDLYNDECGPYPILNHCFIQYHTLFCILWLWWFLCTIIPAHYNWWMFSSVALHVWVLNFSNCAPVIMDIIEQIRKLYSF